MADNSPVVQRLAALAPVMQQAETEEDTQFKAIQRMDAEDDMQFHAIQREQAPVANNTGLPDTLKSGIETLSGMAMDHVRVHRNSDKPAQVGAHAYAQGSQIHLAPGQERHLPHEAWHVVQQAQGRVKPTMQLKGVAVNDDAGLEREADVMGARAMQTAQLRAANSPPPTAPDVMQRKIGFELELLALVDVNGRPPPEKTYLGRYGTQNLELQVDQNGAVEGTTPTPARDANFAVTVNNPAPPAMPGPGDRVALGAYDLRQGDETRVGQNPAGPVAADPRAAALNHPMMTAAGWNDATRADRYNRPPNNNNTGLNNAHLIMLDNLMVTYEQHVKNWEADRAAADAAAISMHAQQWSAANTNPPVPTGLFDFAQKRRRTRYLAAQQTLSRLNQQATAHITFWTDPVNANIPAHMARLYRRPTVNHPNPAFSPRHPIAGAGTDRYASILEIVTKAYAPETVNGRADLVTAMTEAAALAAGIGAATGNFANRAALNTIPNVTAFDPQAHVGSDHPTRSPQSLAASIQATFALDLAQMAAFVKSTAGFGPQTRYTTKHQGDVAGHGPMGEGAVNQFDRQIVGAVRDATAAVNDLKAHIGGGAPDFVNLRGLLILICQYLRMGRYWEGALDKNLTNLLSRTDLSAQYQRLVPQNEKQHLDGAARNYLYGRILHHTQRDGGTAVFNNATETRAGPTRIPTTCNQFIRNVFTAGADGITARLGGFRQLAPESVDPGGARFAERADPTAAAREGAVFELRNMIPKLNGAERFAPGEWVDLAVYMAELFAILNAQPEANATQDTVVQDQSRVGVDASGHSPGMAAPNVNIIRTDAAW